MGRRARWPSPRSRRYHAHADHEDGVGDAVGHRVEEGAPDRGGAGRLGHRAVEEVVQAGDDQEDDGEVEVARGDQDRRRGRRDEPGRGEHVSSDAMAVECLADRTGGPVDGGSPAAVEHEAPRRAPPGIGRHCGQQFTIRSPKHRGAGALPGPVSGRSDPAGSTTESLVHALPARPPEADPSPRPRPCVCRDERVLG